MRQRNIDTHLLTRVTIFDYQLIAPFGILDFLEFIFGLLNKSYIQAIPCWNLRGFPKKKPTHIAVGLLVREHQRFLASLLKAQNSLPMCVLFKVKD